MRLHNWQTSLQLTDVWWNEIVVPSSRRIHKLFPAVVVRDDSNTCLVSNSFVIILTEYFTSLWKVIRYFGADFYCTALCKCSTFTCYTAIFIRLSITVTLSTSTVLISRLDSRMLSRVNVLGLLVFSNNIKNGISDRPIRDIKLEIWVKIIKGHWKNDGGSIYKFACKKAGSLSNIFNMECTNVRVPELLGSAKIFTKSSRYCTTTSQTTDRLMTDGSYHEPNVK